MIDGAIRRLNQMDATIFSSGHPARWRHFLESDFAVSFSLVLTQFLLHYLTYVASVLSCKNLCLVIDELAGWLQP